MSDLKSFFSRMLTAKDAIVEPIEPDGINLLLPRSLQQSLKLPEFCRLGFGPITPDNAEKVTLNTDYLECAGEILGNDGRFLSLSYNGQSSYKWPSNPDLLLQKNMGLTNAAYRLKDTKKTTTSYLLLTCKAVAISDEKREDVLHLCINEGSGCVAEAMENRLISYVRSISNKDYMKAEKIDATLPLQKVAELAIKQLPVLVEKKFAPFLSAMERRMGRDLDRLHTYYSDLQREAAQRYVDKQNKKSGEEICDRERLKLSAIEREYPGKVEDLKRKFAITIETELIQLLRITMPVYRLCLTVMRKKGKRDIFIDWNPLSRKLELPACEACFSPLNSCLVCNENLHMLCSKCLSVCDVCNKRYCRACSPGKCSRCV